MPSWFEDPEYFAYYARRIGHILQHLRAKCEIELTGWNWQALCASYDINQRRNRKINCNIGLDPLLQ